MALLTEQQLASAKDLIFREGRLLERQLYRYFFEDGDRAACIKALQAYQNPDGGFGNGIEPDLLCPGSSAIGAETALYVLNLLELPEPRLVLPLLNWLAANQDDAGGMRHPPQDLTEYPHQPWWQGDDQERVLTLAAQLSDWQAANPAFFAGARRFYDITPPPTELSFYSYPWFAYLREYQQSEADRATLHQLLDKLPAFLEKHADHFPLFSRYWGYVQDMVEPTVLDKAAASVAAALSPEGCLPNPYPDLPWWRSLFTLDALILLQRRGYLSA